MKELNSGMSLRVPKEAKRIALLGAVGAVTAGGQEYLRQREEIKPSVLLEQQTIRGVVGREVIIFQRVDKRRVAGEAAKGAGVAVVKEVVFHEPRVLPLAA